MEVISSLHQDTQQPADPPDSMLSAGTPAGVVAVAVANNSQPQVTTPGLGSPSAYPETKSWVASRFLVVEEAGVSKRRCKYLNCNKEYSRGTSHMILKRHWSKLHADHFSLPGSKKCAPPPGTPLATDQHLHQLDTTGALRNSSTGTPVAGAQKTSWKQAATAQAAKKRQAPPTPTTTTIINTTTNNYIKSGLKQSVNNTLNTLATNNNNNNNNNNKSTNLTSPANLQVQQAAATKSAKAGNNQKCLLLDVKLVSKRLKEATSIHLTYDIYTPKKGGKSYGIISAHSFGADSLDIKSVLLEYKHLPYPDDSTSVYEFLRTCVAKFNIREKIISVSTNCSETLSGAVQEMDKRYRLSRNFNFTTAHIQCFPQLVHLNVAEVFRSQEACLETVRKIVTFINNNNITLRPLAPQEEEQQQQQQQHDDNNSTEQHQQHPSNPSSVPSDQAVSAAQQADLKATGLKLPGDNKSNWNTTYFMIETFIQQRGYIEPTLLYFQSAQELENVVVDWEKLFTIVQLLKPFHDIINKFYTDNYTPVSLVAVSIPHLMDHLSAAWVYEDLVMVVHNFKLQLEAYRQHFQSDLTVISGLLDPRVKDTFMTPEGKEGAVDMLRKRLDDLRQMRTENQVQQNAASDSFWSQVFRPSNYDEVTDYLESPREHGSTCNIAYWEAHKAVYPNLFILAKTLVCVQASSVPGDRIFSAAENTERERKVQVESTNSKELMRSWAKYLEK